MTDNKTDAELTAQSLEEVKTKPRMSLGSSSIESKGDFALRQNQRFRQVVHHFTEKSRDQEFASIGPWGF